MASRAVLVCYAALCLLVSVHAAICPCEDSSLCNPLQTPPRKELFAFQVSSSNWANYDWTHLTTIVLFDQLDPNLLCKAHSSNVRVVYGADYPVNQLGNETNRQLWIDGLIAKVQNSFADGVNVDIESPIDAQSQQVQQLTSLVKELTLQFHEQIPGSQVTFDVAWSPRCIDGRCYDYTSLADACDFLFVMSYDLRSQVFGPCVASANSPFELVAKGVKDFLDLNIQPGKLVLGVPWYGYDYPCVNLNTHSNECKIEHVPFRGVNCSDAAGTEIDYSVVVQLLQHNATTPRIWNNKFKTPFFNYFNQATHKQHQVWFDDPESLSFKVAVAQVMGLRGIGMWEADALDYSNPHDSSEMWHTLNKFFRN